MKFSINILISLFILILVSACSSGGSAPASDPGISDFSATSTTIAIGSSIELSVEFVGGTGVINNGIGEVTSGTAISVSPATTTTYSLTVTNSAGSIAVTSFVTVTVVALDSLSILNESLDPVFQATRSDYTASVGFLVNSIRIKATSADAASSITVNGITIGADSLSQPIDLFEGTDTVINIIVARNTVSKTYTLTVTRASFIASSTTITIGGSVDLTAFFTDGTGSIDNGVGAVTSGTPVTVSPSTTTTYTLTVTKSDGSPETSALTVTVVGLNFLSTLNESFDQVFQATQSGYTASVGFLAKSIQIKAASVDAASNITVNSVAIGTDNLSQPIDLIEGGDTVINIIVAQNTVSKTYTLTISRALAATFAEQAYIKASNTGNGDEFGYSVALSGDTLAVGAYLEDSSSEITPDEAATDSGAVYVFTRSGSTWVQQAYIKASNIGDGDNFGISVALSGDTLAVGATGEDSITQGVATIPDDLDQDANSGAVYTFVRTGSSWSEEAYIKASNTGDQDQFGISVALYDDTLAVGAIGEDSSTTGVSSTPDDVASNSGAVYVFTRNDTSWSEQAYIKASNTGGSDRFGNSVALSADTLAVGASEEDTWRGAVYIFARSGTIWSEQAYLKASNPDIDDYFGISVALSGDTLAVGAYLEDSNTEGVATTPNNDGSNSGAVYVFVRSGTIWTQQVFIKPFNTSGNDQFGKSVALSGDVLVVGAAREDSNIAGIDQGWNDATKDYGAVYVFTRVGTIWSEQSFIKPSTTVNKDEFGSSVAVAGDTIAVGVPINGTKAGAVYTFE